MTRFVLVFVIFLSVAVHAQDCTVQVKKYRTGRSAVEYALPAQGDVQVMAQGDSWVEIMEPEGYRKRIPKISPKIYRDNFFEADKLNPEDLRGKTRGQVRDEQARRKYQTYLKKYRCPATPDSLPPFNLFVEGQVQGMNDKPIVSVPQISVYRNGKKVESFEPSDNGRFGFSLGRHMYTVVFDAKDYISKKLMFDGREIPKKEANQGFSVFVDVSLFQPEKGVDYTIFEETPIGLAEYDAKDNSFHFDRKYSEQISNLIDHLRPDN